MKSEWQAKKKLSRSPKRPGSSPAAWARRVYSRAWAKVNATSWGAVAPASRMWYPETEIGFHFGSRSAQ